MKLAVKFALAFVLVAFVVRGITAYLNVKREIALFEEDIKRDHNTLGHDLSTAVTTIWQLGGEEAAKLFVAEANASRSHVLIRLVDLDIVRPGTLPDSSLLPLRRLKKPVEGPLHLISDSLKRPWLTTYIPFSDPPFRTLAIELTESLEERDRYIDTTLTRAAFFTVVIVALTGVASLVLGLIFVGRPITALARRAQQIAAGNLEGRVQLRQKDELGNLGREINSMSDRLAEARRRIADETLAKERALEQLRHADRLATAGRLAAALAHDIGTPLNVIKARARVIAEEDLDGAEVKDFSRIIVDQTARVADTVRSLLSLSGRREAQKNEIDIRLVVKQTADLLDPLTRNNKVHVTVIQPETPLEVLVDPDQIRQVLSNLMVNAIEAMPAGGELKLEIRQTAATNPASPNQSQSHYACVSVSDTGAGIPPHLHDQIFDPFLTTKERGIGTGLGLPIAAEIMREHGGWIDVKSTLGAGSSFTAYLPVFTGETD
jgi:two-component system, NtrC family, sensor kinase